MPLEFGLWKIDGGPTPRTALLALGVTPRQSALRTE